MLESHHFAISSEIMDPDNKQNGCQNLQVKGQRGTSEWLDQDDTTQLH